MLAGTPRGRGGTPTPTPARWRLVLLLNREFLSSGGRWEKKAGSLARDPAGMLPPIGVPPPEAAGGGLSPSERAVLDKASSLTPGAVAEEETDESLYAAI